jgi:hypothetical protein
MRTTYAAWRAKYSARRHADAATARDHGGVISSTARREGLVVVTMIRGDLAVAEKCAQAA